MLADATLTAVMGRMSTYTGRELSWDWVQNASKLDLTPEKLELGDLPVPPVPLPGLTPLV
jgi:myo-inositol 2-dehydrogenase / D-chiro-inositol 1-dehydrogenase